MTWTLKLPHRGDRSAPLSDCAFAARHLPQDEDRRVCRQLVMDWATSGVRTIGEALDRLEEMAPSERRLLLDRCRADAGLASIDDVERAERARAPLALPTAPLEPTTELIRREDGTFYERQLVAPRTVRTPSGGIVDANELEADAARQRAAEESDRRQRQARAADAAADAAAYAEHERGMREQLRAESPEHIRRLL